MACADNTSGLSGSQDMQQSGTPSPSCPGSYPSASDSDCLPLGSLSAAACGSESENAVRPQRDAAGPHGCVVLSVIPAAVDEMRSTMMFYLCYLLCLALGLASMVCVCLWNSRWRGGFAWDGSALQFNWHPVLMVTGLLVLYGYGAVLYRVPLTWGQNKRPWKLLHAALMLCSLILSILGLCAVFDFHNTKKIANLYSLHSWIGIAVVALFALQWLVGFAGFLLPCSPVSLRKLLKPAHVWLGGSILLLSTAACISGINQKLFFVLKAGVSGAEAYSSLPAEAVFGNSLGVLIVAFSLVVLMILANKKWQRPDSRPEDMAYTPLLQEEND